MNKFREFKSMWNLSMYEVDGIIQCIQENGMTLSIQVDEIFFCKQ